MAVKKGDKIKVEYEGKFEDGNVFDSSEKHGGEPLQFEAGAGQVVKGFDNAVIGMNKGEEKEFKLKPEEAYGERRDELKQKIPKSSLPEEQEPKEGMMLTVGTPDGNRVPVRITEVEKDTITLDLNHPLAGKTLIFKIKIVDIESGDVSKKK